MNEGVLLKKRFHSAIEKRFIAAKEINLKTFADLQRTKKCEISDTIFYL